MTEEEKYSKAGQTLDKCKPCYFKDDCMLTVFMAKSCLGPYRDLKHRLKIYDKEIKDREKKQA